MKNVITLGKTSYYGQEKTVQIEFELKEEERESKRDFETLNNVKGKYFVFSAMGNIGLGKGMVACGQLLDEVKEMILKNKIKSLDKDKKALSLEIISIWEKYHLNDMKMGTKAQETALLDMKEKWEYETACNFLSARDLKQNYGYEYGSAWLLEQIPTEVVNRIKEIHEQLKD